MDDFNPGQLITLCALFIGFHVLALPPFLWAMRFRQFAGPEQKAWNLDSGASPDAPITPLPAAPITPKGRLVLGVLGFMALTMLASIFLVVFMALHATGHPTTGKCPI